MIFRSPFPDVPLPTEPLHAFTLRRAAELGDKPALIDGPSGRTLTYAGLAAGVERVAANLAARGLRPGDVVGLFLPNVPEFALAFYGTLRAGGVVTTLSPLATEHDVTVQLQDARAGRLVTVRAFLDRALPAARAVGIAEVYVLDHADEGLPFAALLGARRPGTCARDRPGGDSRGAALLERHHRPAQGRHAHAPEPRRERRADAGHAAPRRAGQHHRRAAVLPHLRHDGGAHARAAHRRHHRHDAALRPRAVPGAHGASTASRAPSSPRRPSCCSPSTRPWSVTISRRCASRSPAPPRSTPRSRRSAGRASAAPSSRATA